MSLTGTGKTVVWHFPITVLKVDRIGVQKRGLYVLRTETNFRVVLETLIYVLV